MTQLWIALACLFVWILLCFYSNRIELEGVKDRIAKLEREIKEIKKEERV